MVALSPTICCHSIFPPILTSTFNFLTWTIAWLTFLKVALLPLMHISNGYKFLLVFIYNLAYSSKHLLNIYLYCSNSAFFFSYVANNSFICPSWTSKISFPFMFSSINSSFYILVSFNCLTKFPMVSFNYNTPYFSLFNFFYDHKCGLNPMPMCSNLWSMLLSSSFCLTNPSCKWLMSCQFVSIIGKV